MTHICVGKLTIIASDNGLSPGRRQAIIWTNSGILLIWPLWTNFSGILIKIHTFSFKKMHLKMSSAKWRPFCFGLNLLTKLLRLQNNPSYKHKLSRNSNGLMDLGHYGIEIECLIVWKYRSVNCMKRPSPLHRYRFMCNKFSVNTSITILRHVVTNISILIIHVMWTSSAIIKTHATYFGFNLMWAYNDILS